MKNSLVSIIIPTHNRVDRLKRAIASVEAQDYLSIELLVVDDGSHDGTAEFLKTYTSSRSFRWFRHQKPLGACAARNWGISEAKGEYVAFLDDDDCFARSRVSKCLLALNEKDAAVTTWDEFISDTGSVGVWKKPSLIALEQLLFRNRVGNTILVKTEYLRTIDGYDLSLTSAQDHDLVIRLAYEFGPIRTVKESLYQIDVADENSRITTSHKAWVGYYDCYVKHKAIMTVRQRRSNLYTVLKKQGKSKLTHLLFLVPIRFWPTELIDYFTSR
ncbi:MAG: hypothetical protein CMD33_10195 [Flavobacteriales bacterium]|nr:hypothetical protein [Flavobacteriales bacterium]